MSKDVWDSVLVEKAVHPKAQKQDILKLIVQACFGVAHLHLDEKESLRLLEIEKQQVIHGKETIQYIGNDLCRVPLSFMETKYLPLWNLLFMATMRFNNTDVCQFDEAIMNMRETYRITDEEVKKAKEGVHHSALYHTSYQPHYRVIKHAYVNYFEAIAYVWKKKTSEEHTQIAIDGRCASGKTTLSLLLEEIFQIQILHLDDYFLPKVARNAKRLAEVGGNIDYERFQEEILNPLQKRESIYYKRYDCQHDSLHDPIEVRYQMCTIWEGSYAYHPKFQSDRCTAIVVTCDEEIQKERLKIRSPHLYDQFVRAWIPMEEAYFKKYQIKEKSAVVIDTSTF